MKNLLNKILQRTSKITELKLTSPDFKTYLKKYITIFRKYKDTTLSMYSSTNVAFINKIKNREPLSLFQYSLISMVPLFVGSKIFSTFKTYCIFDSIEITTIVGILKRMFSILNLLDDEFVYLLFILLTYTTLLFPYITITGFINPRNIVKKLKVSLYYIMSIFFIIYGFKTIGNILSIITTPIRPESIDVLELIKSTEFFSEGISSTLTLIAMNIITNKDTLNSAIVLVLLIPTLASSIYLHYIAMAGFGYKYYQATLFTFGFLIYMLIAPIIIVSVLFYLT
jgi:hypothetical protein